MCVTSLRAPLTVPAKLSAAWRLILLVCHYLRSPTPSSLPPLLPPSLTPTPLPLPCPCRLPPSRPLKTVATIRASQIVDGAGCSAEPQGGRGRGGARGEVGGINFEMNRETDRQTDIRTDGRKNRQTNIE